MFDAVVPEAAKPPASLPPLTKGVSRRLSKRSLSWRKATPLPPPRVVPPKPEVPEKLLKLLQKSTEQQAQLSAVKAILADDVSARNEHSVDVVYAWMMRNCQQYSNNIFGSAPEYIRREICRQMKLHSIKSNGLIIRQGDTGDRCYIVIDGLVDIYIKKDKPPLDHATRRRSSALLESQDSGGLPAVSEFGDMVANLGPGAMFGEVVLLNPSARRNATILASQYTDASDLICLERADYTRLVRTASMEASHYNNAVILDHMFLFRDWDKHDKMRLVSASRSMHFTANDYLYRAGAEAKWMFIVTAGEVKERMNWSLAAGDPAMRALFLQSSKKHPERVVNVELVLVGQGDLTGELPIVTAKRSAAFDIKAVTDVHVLALERRFYESVMLAATRELKPAVHATVARLKKLAQDREDWRQQRIQCGISYPNAPVTITWQLMRMSNARCPRCGQRGHLLADTARCEFGQTPIPSTAVRRSPRESSKTHKKPIGPLPPESTSPRAGRPRHTANGALRDLFDDSYLPTPKELLEHCRNGSPRRQPASAVGS